jgi:glycosyltransferase involved in cell wall biosynthesis
VIPARNAADTLASTLDSVCSQIEGPDAIVVGDDHSTDATAAIARSFGAAVVVPQGRGAAAARIRALQELNTDLVAFLDADDRWSRGYCGAARRIFAGGGRVIALACRVDVDDAGRELCVRRPPQAVTPLDLLRRNRITTSGVVVPRAAVEEAGGFNEAIRHCEDLDLWLRLIDAGYAPRANDEVVYYRVKTAREDLDKVEDVERNRYRVLERAIDLLHIEPDAVALIRRDIAADLAHRYLWSGHRRAGLRCLAESGWRPSALPLGLVAGVPAGWLPALRRGLRAVRRRAVRVGS